MTDTAETGNRPRGGVVHWLVRIAERAGHGDKDRPEIQAGSGTPEAWTDVTRAYGISDLELSALVADYFRLEVADFAEADPNAALLIPETMARKHLVFPLVEDDRRFVVATCDPTNVEAEKCVIRVLDSSATLSLDDLEIPTGELERLRNLLTNRDGIVVITGPTGSGKTTTLYGALRELADGKVNIMTVEDPVEYELPGITQTQVRTKQGMTFASALRAMLRQDPDVILVGEIRDKETAITAAQAAMTGHLVLTTVHANDAVSAIARLADLGLQYSTIAQTLRGAVAQRLLRKVCASCAEPVRGQLTPDEQRLTERHGMEPVVRAVGCTECGFTGYRGRLPVNEVLIGSPRVQQAIEQRKSRSTLTRLAEQGGMRTLHEVGLEWVVQGKTTLVEVDRVLGQDVTEGTSDESDGPPRILLVDDDEDARLLMRSLLERDGYHVDDAEDGHRALDILKGDQDYQLIVLDLAMPGLDGRQVLDQIRGSVDTAALPVLIRTATGSDELEAELLEAGADDYVEKSVDADRFMARVHAVLRRAL